MKQKLVLLLSTLLCSALVTFSQSDIPCEKLLQRGVPKMAVNDGAKILDDSTKVQLERKIRDYYDKTSIPIVVATIDTLNGYERSDYATSLFRCWGIGNSTTNLGVLLFISYKDHAMEVRTGNGIEFVLTDVRARYVIDEMRPLFRAGQNPQAITAGVDKIISILGVMSWADREELRKAEEAAKKANREKITNGLLQILLYVGMVGALIALLYMIAKWRRLLRLRKQMKLLILSTTNEIVTGEAMLEKLWLAYEKAPTWAQKEAHEHIHVSKGHFNEARVQINNAKGFVKDNPVMAENWLRKAHDLIQKSFQNFQTADTKLGEKIKQYRVEAPLQAALAQNVVQEGIAYIGDLESRGYRLPTASGSLKN